MSNGSNADIGGAAVLPEGPRLEDAEPEQGSSEHLVLALRLVETKSCRAVQIKSAGRINALRPCYHCRADRQVAMEDRARRAAHNARSLMIAESAW